MNVHASLLGLHQPGPGWLFRLPVGWKYLIALVVSVPALVLGSWWVTLLSLFVVLVVAATSGLWPRRMLSVGWMLWALLVGLAVFQLLALRPSDALMRPGNILVAVLAARLLTLTTSTPVLMDALATALTPLRWLGLDPERAALGVALMIRSIPYLFGSVDDARDAARARGLERSPARLLMPVMLGAVGYAQQTGEALQARGLGDRGVRSGAAGRNRGRHS